MRSEQQFCAQQNFMSSPVLRFKRLDVVVASTFLVLSPWLSQPVLAADECGPAGASVTCSYMPGNYATGITYAAPPTGMALQLDSTVVVIRSPGAGADGVSLTGNGDGLLDVRVAIGAQISSEGTLADGVQVATDANNSIHVVTEGIINVVVLGELNPGVGTNAVLGWTRNTSSEGNISLVQTADGAITVRGFEISGLYGLNQGLGSVTVVNEGAITVDGFRGFGVNAWNTNPLATGDTHVELAVTGQIINSSDEGVGAYSLNGGLGAASASLSGRIEISGSYADGAISYISNIYSLAGATVSVAPTATIVTTGNNSMGARALGSGPIDCVKGM